MVNMTISDVRDMRDVFTKPFHYDSYGQMIFDAQSHMVLQIRGWGYLHMETTEEIATMLQDKLGQEIVDMLNKEPV
jgi:hypothetical protein